jgi:choline dehydrogenase-like flavoprotein
VSGAPLARSAKLTEAVVAVARSGPEATMFTDARALPDGTTLRADVCIVGAGAAGVTLALALAGGSDRVVVLEGGGVEDEPGGPGIYRVTPDARDALTVDRDRRRYFGGNTNHWFGVCRRLDDTDFEPRDWIPHSGWPIRGADLLPFYAEAERFCRVDGDGGLDGEASPHSRSAARVDPALLTGRIQRSLPVSSFGDLYRERVGAAADVQVCVHAHAVGLDTDADGRTVSAVRAAAADGRRIRVEAGRFVLAAGGVENARLLLASDGASPAGLGNSHDLVGRFFMEHPFLDIPVWPWAGRPDLAFYITGRPPTVARTWGQLVLSDAFVRRERVPGQCLWFPTGETQPLGVISAARLRDGLLGRRALAEPLTEARTAIGDHRAALRYAWRRLRGTAPREGLVLRVVMEQAPDPDNRVRLSNVRDAFGVRCAELTLPRAGDRRRQCRALGRAAAALGLDGRGIARQARLLLDAGRVDFFWHHMGTTRMHADPRHGVVDADCRVHGVSNLFVAGSSVFPTSGTAGPTLTIVALALRLARHLRRSSAP